MDTETPEPEKTTTEKQERKSKKEPSPFLTPASVLVAGAMIAGAIIYSQASFATQQGGNVAAVPGNDPSASAMKVKDVSDKDHILGSKGAEITLIEFSDFQCPFCAALHPTLSRIVTESNGNINWVYRFFPLNSIHPEATPAALASECVAKYAGNEAFWKFADDLFKNQQRLGTPLYEKLSKTANVPPADFASCMTSEDTTARITENLDDAVASGGQGTPYVVIVNNTNKKKSSFSGALSYGQIVAQIDSARGK